VKGKYLRYFLVTITIINVIFCMVIFGILDIMQNVIGWKTILVIIFALIVYMVVNALNIVYYVKKGKNNGKLHSESNC